MAAQREPLVPAPSQGARMREAADRAVYEIGGWQTVADRLHTSPAFLRKLRSSRRSQDIADLVLMIGRAKAVDNQRKAAGKPPVDPQQAPEAPPLLRRPELELAQARAAARTEDLRIAAIVGLPWLAKRLEMDERKLAERLFRGDSDLALMIEAVVIPDIPGFHRTTTT